MLWCHQLIGFRVTWRHERCSLLNMALTSATSTPHQWRESARVGLRGPMEQLSWLLIGALIITTVNLWHHGGTIWSVRLVTSLTWQHLRHTPACKSPVIQEQRDWKRDICCARWQTVFQREDSIVISSPSPCFHPPAPPGLLPLEYENTLSLNKSLPQLQFISLFCCFLCCGRWDLGMKWNYWSYQCKMAKLAQTKAICLYSLGKSESSLIILWLELILGPCLSLSPWEPDTMYCVLLKIPNTYSNPWCRLLIDFRVRWRTEKQRWCKPNVKKQEKVDFLSLLQIPQCYMFETTEGKSDGEDYSHTYLYSVSQTVFGSRIELLWFGLRFLWHIFRSPVSEPGLVLTL